MSKNVFNSVKYPKVGSNWFNLTHDVKLSLDMGKLVPILCEECIPGDKWQLKSSIMLRFQPLVSPMMHRVKAYVHYFFVPNRLVWSNWEKFISPVNQDSGSEFPLPYKDMNFNELQIGSLADYLGLPHVSSGSYALQKMNMIPFAAYHRIYDEYYKDQNLTPEKESINLVNGNNSGNISGTIGSAMWQVRTRAWQHDYFTAALPWPQKGDDVLIPIGEFSDVSVYREDGVTDGFTKRDVGGPPDDGPANFPGLSTQLNDDNGNDLRYNPGDEYFAETSSLQAEAQSITTLRRAFKLQEWLEKNARSGTRYVESILAHFGVKSSDARMNRPEFIGGTSQPMVISEVLQTAEGTDPVGNMAGHGVSVGNSGNMSYYCEEHGFLFAILSVMPVTAYQQGIPRKFLKNDPFMYAWPTFQHIGEQEVIEAELYAQNGYVEGVNDGVFGYVPRYSEYKFAPSRVCGDFKETLDFWHMGRIFSEKPVLNQSFVNCDPTNRVFAVEDGNKVLGQVLHANRVRRKLAKFGNPMM